MCGIVPVDRALDYPFGRSRRDRLGATLSRVPNATGEDMDGVLRTGADERAQLVARLSSRAALVEAPRVAAAGILWRADTIVTAAEAVAHARCIQVTVEGGERVRAEPLGIDLATDVAVLRAPGMPAEPIETGDSGTLRVGDPVLVAGRDRRGPLAHWSSVAQVGPAWHSRRGGRLERWLRLAGLEPELEGASVFDLQGRLCAMAVLGPRRRVTGIPVETIARVVALIERHGHLPRPYLGLALRPVALETKALAEPQERALMVLGVDPGSPAAAAGVLQGDVLLRADGAVLEDVSVLTRLLLASDIGHALDLEILRAGQKQAVSLRSAERPAA
jgi:S1-C subfamily serine protease